MTRNDALANIALAKAAKSDSNSMKVIAVMTMAFLPGTFVAALFAVPSLQWGSTPVIQDDFWVYLAFTLPATAMVFVVWFAFSEGSSLWRSASRAVQQAQKILHRSPRGDGDDDGNLKSSSADPLGPGSVRLRRLNIPNARVGEFDTE